MDDIYWQKRLKEKEDELNRLAEQIRAQAETIQAQSATIKELNDLILAMVEEKKNATTPVQETPPLF